MLHIVLAIISLLALPATAQDWGRYQPNPAGLQIAQAPIIEPPPSPALQPRRPVSDIERRLHLATDAPAPQGVPRMDFTLPHGLRLAEPPKPYTPKPGEVYYPPPPGLPVVGPIGGRP